MRNPWMSLWLSAANSWMGVARGAASAEMQRQQRRVVKAVTEQTAGLWRRALTGETPAEPEPRRRAAKKRKAS